MTFTSESRPMTVFSLSSLPIELILLIFELLYFGVDGFPDHQTLSSCSLVCAMWRDPAQQLLFRSLELQTANNHIHPLSSLTAFFGSSGRGQLLSSHVRTIRVKVSGSKNLRAGSVSYKEIDCADIVTLFPRLYELSLYISYSDLDSEVALNRFHCAAKRDSFPRRIRSLKLFGHQVHPALLYGLLSLWPTVRFLSVNTDCDNFFDPPPPRERPNLELVQLKLFYLPNEEVLQWLVPNHSLKIVDLSYACSDTSAILRFLGKEGKHLRSFKFTFSNVASDVASSLLDLCPNLEELVLDSILMEDLEIIKHLPKSLEHVHIIYLKTCFAQVCRIVCALPRLRVLSLLLPPDEDDKEYEASKELEKECAARGVVLVYNGRRNYLPDDAVMGKRFPRGRSVSNFSLMN